MTIIEALKSTDHAVRLSNGNAWMTYSPEAEMYCVYRGKSHQLKNEVLYVGLDEDNAVEALLRR